MWGSKGRGWETDKLFLNELINLPYLVFFSCSSKVNSTRSQIKSAIYILCFTRQVRTSAATALQKEEDWHFWTEDGSDYDGIWGTGNLLFLFHALHYWMWTVNTNIPCIRCLCTTGQNDICAARTAPLAGLPHYLKEDSSEVFRTCKVFVCSAFQCK